MPRPRGAAGPGQTGEVSPGVYESRGKNPREHHLPAEGGGIMSLMTTETAGGYLALSPKRIRELIKSGELPAVRIGREYRIDDEDLRDFILRNKTTLSP